MHAFAPRPFGPTGVTSSRIGLGSSYGLGPNGVERAFERGINFFLWGSLRKEPFARGVRNLVPTHRREIVLAVQSYTRLASFLERSVDKTLRALGTDYVDVLCLAWWNGPTPERILDAAVRLQEKRKARSLMVSCHHRPAFERFIAEPRLDAIMLRYSAAHTGAEREVFPHLERAARRPGVVAFTATRWGTLLDPRAVPPGEKTPRASDCYRFALSSPFVDISLAGPKNDLELEDALTALDKGPLDPEELAWMRRIGAHVRERAPKPGGTSVLDLIDKLATASICGPKQLRSG
jgi:aryl-alcohol dehydrogenase-like predicted oxidoreductase